MAEDGHRAVEDAAAELRRLRTLVRLAATCTWHTDATGGFAEPQPCWEAFSGQDWATHRGYGWSGAVHPDDRERVIAQWQAALAGGASFAADARVWHAGSSSYRHITARAAPLRDADGRIEGWAGMFLDIDDRRRARAAQQAIEERYRRAVTSAAVPVMLHADDGEILAVSDGLVAATGYGRQQLCRFADWLALAYGDRAAELGARVDRRFAERQPIPGVEVEVRTAAGATRTWVWSAPPPERLADGRLCFFAIASDVTERKRAEAALRVSEERYRLATAAIDGIVYDWDLVAGTIERSARVAEIVGLPAEAIPADPGWWATLIHPDDRDRALAEGAQLQAGGASRMRMEYRVRHAGGSWISVVDQAFLVRDAQGRVARIVGLTTDVTARQEARRALEASEERLRLASDAAHIGIHDYDLVAGTLRWDRRVRELWGVGPDVPVDYDLFVRGLHPDDRAMVLDAVARALAPGGVPYAVEFRVRGIEDGLERWIAATGQVTFAGERPLRLVGTVLDVTGRKRTEAELRGLVRQRDMLLRELHHRVKNNLQLISSLLRLQASRQASPEVRAFVDPAVRRIEAIGATWDILNRAQLAGSVGLAAYLRDLCAELAASYADAGGLELDIAASDARLDTERAIPLGLIVNELVTNAFKHGLADAGPVRVRLGAGPGGRWHLSVSNHHVPGSVPPHPGFGLQLIAIIARQLDGQVTVDLGADYAVSLDFRL
ncbi:MAG: PAS domain-containing protein [Geminicoccaceae bacterium]